AKEVIKIFVSKGIIPTCYFEDFDSDGILNIGTNKGLFAYEKSTNRIRHVLEPPDNGPLTITRIFSKKYSAFMWISTLERGMVRLSTGFGNSMRAYPYKKSKDGRSIN